MLTGLFRNVSLLSVLYQFPAFARQLEAVKPTGGPERPRQGAGA